MSASLLLALVLASPRAEAAYTPKIKNIRIRQTTDSSYKIGVIVKHDDADEVANVEVSAGGGPSTDAELEDVHVALTGDLSALPVDSATLSLALTDALGDTVATLTGTLASDGSIALAVPGGRGDDGGDCGARTGCGDADPVGESLDLAAMGSFVVDGDETFSVSLVLHGADALLVSGATLSLAESFQGEEVCVATDRSGACIQWGYTSYSEESEVALTVGSPEWVWSTDLPTDFAIGDQVQVKLRDSAGDKLDQVKESLALPIDDGGAGIPVGLVDDDPETWLSLLPVDDGTGDPAWGLTLFTGGWAFDDDTPVEAELTLDSGDVWTPSAHSYQVSAWVPVTFSGDPSGEVFALEQDGIHQSTYDTIMKCNVDITKDLYSCGAIEQDDDGQWGLALTVYAEDPTDLPATSTVVLTATSGNVTTEEASYKADFGDTFGVVFATAVDFIEDPIGAELAIDVKVIGRDGNKKRYVNATLNRGSVGIGIDVNEDGTLVATTIDPDAITEYRGDILIGGEPIGIERTVGDESVPTAVPVVQAKNGVGTRHTATAHGGKPGLL